MRTLITILIGVLLLSSCGRTLDDGRVLPHISWNKKVLNTTPVFFTIQSSDGEISHVPLLECDSTRTFTTQKITFEYFVYMGMAAIDNLFAQENIEDVTNVTCDDQKLRWILMDYIECIRPDPEARNSYYSTRTRTVGSTTTTVTNVMEYHPCVNFVFDMYGKRSIFER